MLMQDMRRN